MAHRRLAGVVAVLAVVMATSAWAGLIHRYVMDDAVGTQITDSAVI